MELVNDSADGAGEAVAVLSEDDGEEISAEQSSAAEAVSWPA